MAVGVYGIPGNATHEPLNESCQMEIEHLCCICRDEVDLTLVTKQDVHFDCKDIRHYIHKECLDSYLSSLSHPNDAKCPHCRKPPADANNTDKLIMYIKKQDVDAVRDMLSGLYEEARVEMLDSMDTQGEHPLLLAARREYVDIVSLLLEMGANVDKQDPRTGKTALMLAMSFHNQDLLKSLCDYGPNVTLEDKEGWNAFLIAAKYEFFEGLGYLLDQGLIVVDHKNQFGETGLIIAAFYDRIDTVHYLVEYGLAGVNIRDNRGVTAYQYAYEKGFEDIASYLEMSGSSTGTYFPSYPGTIMKAIERHDMRFVEFLIEDVQLAPDTEGTEEGITPLMKACQLDQQHIVSLLLRHSAKLQVTDMDGRNAFMHAVLFNSLKVVRYLIEHTESPILELASVKDTLGRQSALFLAPSKEMASMLIQAGVEYRVLDGRKNTPLTLACASSNMDLVKFYVETTDLNDVAVENQWTYCVHTASYSGRYQVVEYLLKRGDRYAMLQDSKHFTALEYASMTGHVDIIEMMILLLKVSRLDLECAYLAAMGAGNQDAIKALIEVGAAQYRARSCEPLMHAISMNKSTIAKFFLINMNKRAIKAPYACPVDLIYALREAVVSTRDGQLVALLLELGARDSWQDDMRQTALMLATKADNMDAMVVLLNKAKDRLRMSRLRNYINARDVMGRTALFYACNSTRSDFYFYLKHRGADVGMMDDQEHTPLMMAAGRGNILVVRDLLQDHHVNINHQDKLGQTALMMAAKNSRSVPTLALLLEKGAHVSKKDGAGRTALMFSCLGNNVDGARILLEQAFEFIDINEMDGQGYNALVYAAIVSRNSVSRPLLEILKLYGATVNVRDRRGYSPLMNAVAQGHFKVMKLLIEELDAQTSMTDSRGYSLLEIAKEYNRTKEIEYLSQQHLPTSSSSSSHKRKRTT